MTVEGVIGVLISTRWPMVNLAVDRPRASLDA
jgi:hypothetical protein